MARRIIESVEKQFKHYKALGDPILTRTPEQYLQWHSSSGTIDIATLAMHMTVHMSTQWGIMLQQDIGILHHNTHENNRKSYTRADLLSTWEEGWNNLFRHLENSSDETLLNSIQIKDRSFTYFDILVKKLTHAAYHTGQLVFISKLITDQQSNTSQGYQRVNDFMLSENPTSPIAVAFSPNNLADPDKDPEIK